MTKAIPFSQSILRLMWGNKRQRNRFERKYIASHEQSGEAYWYYKFRKLHPNLDLNQSDPGKLRLILGLGRSGTTWVGRMLATSTTPLRYFEEPLHSIIPPLSFANAYNHTAIRFSKALPDRHRLVFAYKLLTLPDCDWNKLGNQHRLIRDDQNFRFCLVKEVHSLLATEALLDKFQVPTIIVIRNPLYTVDSLFDAFSLAAPYFLNHESLIIEDPLFLDLYLPNIGDKVRSTFDVVKSWPDGRKKTVHQGTLLASIMTKMLESVGEKSKSAHIIRYEELCLSPQKGFTEMAAFLGLDWTKNSVDALSDTTNYNGERDHFSVKRNTLQQIGRPFRFLTQDELEDVKEMLQYCELEYSTNTC